MGDECLNCGAPIKNGLLANNPAASSSDLAFINAAREVPIAGACNKCGPNLAQETIGRITARTTELRESLEQRLAMVPLCSIHSPIGWEYDVIGLVTAQSVTGTGIFSDVTSAFTDLFGTQSGAYNTKIRGGEFLCRTSLRTETIDIGGNAVLGVDVDYAEVGGQRAMLMVCMTGTAVRLRNPECISPDFADKMKRYPADKIEYKSLLNLVEKTPGFY
jgi:uncharacterized protein YbjQ (UPF0145 family)